MELVEVDEFEEWGCDVAEVGDEGLHVVHESHEALDVFARSGLRPVADEVEFFGVWRNAFLGDVVAEGSKCSVTEFALVEVEGEMVGGEGLDDVDELLNVEVERLLLGEDEGVVDEASCLGVGGEDLEVTRWKTDVRCLSPKGAPMNMYWRSLQVKVVFTWSSFFIWNCV